MDGVGTAQCVRAGQLAGVALDRGGELYRLGSRPERLPVPLGGPEGTSVDSVIASGRRQRGPNLRVGKAARHGGVTSVPQGSGNATPVLVDDELYQRAGVKIDERHAGSAALLADQVSH